jgi:CheY-like chemotaxis protein
MGGGISVNSKLGVGSDFTVYLPQKTMGAKEIGPEVSENLRQLRSSPLKIKRVQIIRELMPYGSVLIVDDMKSNLHVAKGLISPYKLKTDTAVSGHDAVEKIKSGNVYDIVFMDHMMPDMDGIETVKIIRDWGYEGIIVALTANAIAGQSEMFLANGFDDFISKPIDIRQLNAILNKFVRDRRPQEAAGITRDCVEDGDPDKSSEMASFQIVGAELTGAFISDAEKAIAVFEDVCANNIHRKNDIQMFITNMHAIKSALSNVGETELSGIALKLEQKGREGDLATLRDETQVFLDALRKVVEKITHADDNLQP